MRVLVAEDDKEIRDVLCLFLRKECFAVDSVDNGEEASFLARTTDYDLILMDQVMPRMRGRDACREIRKAGIGTPVILLTVMDDPRFKVDAFNEGVDDFLCKPYAIDELVARMRAVMRRPRSVRPPESTVGDLIVDGAGQTARRGQRELILTRREFMLLEYLARNAGRVLSRGELIEHVWERDADPFSNTIEVHIANLRKKLREREEGQMIHTIIGRGYKLDARPTTS
jgi:DNA-binding response OmpR family regulator